MTQKNNQINIVKRNGKKELLDISKISKVVAHACNGLSGVSQSEVEIKSQLKFYNNMSSEEIQETLIKSAADLISENSPNYQYVAGRLVNYQLRKKIYGKFEPPTLLEHVKKIVNLGYYTPELLSWYNENEFTELNNFIIHDKDDNFSYAAMEQFRDKYLVQNRVTSEHFETPQFLYMLVAMSLFHMEKENRIEHVKNYYNLLSDGVVTIPTPILAGVRTPQKQFSSCVLINVDDSLDSINAAANSIVKYVSQKAGIGVNVGRIRAKGSPVRKGDTSHTGIIPFMKYLHSATKSCSQGGVRGGAATFYYPIWHLEISDLLVLKNNKGTEETRIRHTDYGVQISGLFYERLITGKDITLFCPNDVPDLYEAFFKNQQEFKLLYEKYESRKDIRTKKIKAVDLFGELMKERFETGRIYILNVDNTNEQGSFDSEKLPIYSSNLCLEITLPTIPMTTEDKEIGEIALCTLSAINWGKINKPQDFEKPCYYAVRALDNLLDYQNYPVEAARRHTKKYRPLGIGVTNLAYWLAKNDLSYEGNTETYEKVDEFMEAMSFYCIKASNELAKERGSCDGNANTRYAKGLVPYDLRKKNIDTIVNRNPSMDWITLKNNLINYGIRNATLMALMPVESSSQIVNSTNGVEPPRGFISVKGSKSGYLPQVVPGFPKLKNKYQLLWDLKSPIGYLNICGIITKWIDQSISTNTSYNPEHYPNNSVPLKTLLQHLLHFYKIGGKTLYYNNTKDGSTDEVDNSKKDDSISIVNQNEDDCESCKI